MFLTFLKKARIRIITVFLVIFFDRFFKSLSLVGGFDEPIRLCGGWLSLSFSTNRNIAFSLPLSGPFLEVAIFLIILGLILFFARFIKEENHLLALCFLAIIAGAVSNLFDRLRFGYVVDYIYLKYFSVFNLADALIVVGTIAFVFLIRETSLSKK